MNEDGFLGEDAEKDYNFFLERNEEDTRVTGWMKMVSGEDTKKDHNYFLGKEWMTRGETTIFRGVWGYGEKKVQSHHSGQGREISIGAGTILEREKGATTPLKGKKKV